MGDDPGRGGGQCGVIPPLRKSPAQRRGGEGRDIHGTLIVHRVLWE